MTGPLKGRVFPLDEMESTIGRDPENEISVLDSAVSRRHCTISLAPSGEFRIRDLESRNSTFVNDRPIKDHALQPLDRIRVGASLFLFQPNSHDGPSTEENPDDNHTLVLRPGEALTRLQNNPEAARDLKTLLEFGQAVNTLRTLQELCGQAMRSLLDVIPADRAAIQLEDPGGDPFLAGLERNGPPTDTPVFSKTILDVVREGNAVLSNSIQEDDSFDGSVSLIRRKVTSVLAVPLQASEQRIGAIYLDTNTPGVTFEEHHLQLLTALANVTALAIENVRHLDLVRSENLRLREELTVRDNMVGESAAMREIHQFVSRVAPRESTVLIWGESGTGKELVARAIHANSWRANTPFVAINCAAIAETLLESELFGHEKGAFTGAVAQKKGKLEVANTGTVFLDEIGELAPALQAKLLRVLETHELERVGSTKTIKLDIRVIAATNRDLKEMSKTGAFRQDLYFRLDVVSIRTRPLRERREDIPVLAEHFAAAYAERLNRRITGLSPKARACLIQYAWPGNVRELANAIERAVVMGSGDRILPEDLPEAIVEEAGSAGGEGVTPLHDALREAKKRIILDAIQSAGGNQTEAARLLGVHPNHLFRTIRQLDIRPGKK